MKKSDIIYSVILGVLMFLALIYTKPEHTPEIEDPIIDSLKVELKQCKLQNGTKYRALMIVDGELPLRL